MDFIIAFFYFHQHIRKAFDVQLFLRVQDVPDREERERRAGLRSDWDPTGWVQ